MPACRRRRRRRRLQSIHLGTSAPGRREYLGQNRSMEAAAAEQGCPLLCLKMQAKSQNVPCILVKKHIRKEISKREV
jgi:hypothetical protein